MEDVDINESWVKGVGERSVPSLQFLCDSKTILQLKAFTKK